MSASFDLFIERVHHLLQARVIDYHQEHSIPEIKLSSVSLRHSYSAAEKLLRRFR
ncbi:MAG: hypothetical protein L0Z50_27585 [Verrucomicrobiales bacterium]|nr:hypothetical protein [Verrucomicrobiales bacterium]